MVCFTLFVNSMKLVFRNVQSEFVVYEPVTDYKILLISSTSNYW